MGKRKENKNVPNLRFKEFEGGWLIKKIKDVAEFKVTNSFSRENLNYENGTVRNIHYGDIHTKFQTLFDITKEDVPYINPEINISRIAEDNFCKEGDLVFADASEDLNDVGKSIEIIKLSNEKTLAGLHTILARPKPNIFTIGFCGYLFKSINVRQQIKKEAQGSKVLSISSTRISNIELCFPSINEQKKVTNFLSLIDKRIQTQTKIIRHLETSIKSTCKEYYKKANKTEYSISELGKSYSVMNLSKSDLSYEGRKCILYGELFTTYKCVIDEVKSFTKYDSAKLTLSGDNDILFPSSTTVNAISLIAPAAINEAGVILGGDMFGIQLYKEFSNEYISYVINYIYKEAFAKYAKGSTIIHLHYSDIKDCKILLPSIQEQRHLAILIKLISNKIKTEKKILQQYEKQKKYLLQNMFI